MKNILSYVGIFLFIIFSFFITDKVALVVKQNDPLMDEVKEKTKYYNEDVLESVVTDNTIIPGKNGCVVDINLTYENVKKVGTFSENMIKYNKIFPDNKLSKNLDKYIISGNKLSNNITLLFKIYSNTNENNIAKVIDILDINKVRASIFIDGKYIENNIDYVKSIMDKDIEVLNLGYNKKYNKDMINWNNTILNELKYNNPKICYLEEFSINDITICKNNNMKTVIPNVIVDEKPLTTIKNNLDNGNIISLNITNDVVNELKLIINYINNKGYNLVKLSELISEDNEKCK